MKAALYTLGCKTNQFESQAMERLLQSRGYAIVPFESKADVYIINSCTVTAVSDKKTRQTLRRAAKENPNALIAVCGCYAELAPEELAVLLPGRKILVDGNKNHTAFIEKLHYALTGTCEQEEEVPNLPAEFERLPAGGLAGRTRALLKVQDGCRHFCSYCIIPYARGNLRSLPIAEAVAEAKALATQGYSEIVLTGIEISSYGAERPGQETLLTLTRALCKAVPTVRFRFGSLWPTSVSEEFCRLLALEPNFCPHFHLSVQSGSDATLARMRRPYGVSALYDALAHLRKYFPNAAVTADLICGFPQESEEEFAETSYFLRQANFAQTHIFPFSPRPGTKAAQMDGQISKEVKDARCKIAAEIAKESRIDFLNAQKGKVLQVLFEESQHLDKQTGHSENYMPVEVEAEEPLQGKLLSVKIAGRRGERLLGHLV